MPFTVPGPTAATAGYDYLALSSDESAYTALVLNATVTDTTGDG